MMSTLTFLHECLKLSFLLLWPGTLSNTIAAFQSTCCAFVFGVPKVDDVVNSYSEL